MSTDTLKKFDNSFDDGIDGNSRDHSGSTNPNIIRWSKHTSMSPETPPNPLANQRRENQYQPDDNDNGINQQNQDQYHDDNQSRSGNHSNKLSHFDTGPFSRGGPMEENFDQIHEVSPVNPMKNEKEQQRFHSNQLNEVVYEEKEMSPDVDEVPIEDFKIDINDSMAMEETMENEDVDLHHEGDSRKTAPPMEDEHIEQEMIQNLANSNGKQQTQKSHTNQPRVQCQETVYATKQDLSEVMANLQLIRKEFAQLTDDVKEQELEMETSKKKLECIQKGEVYQTETQEVAQKMKKDENGGSTKLNDGEGNSKGTRRSGTKRRFKTDFAENQNASKRRRFVS